LSLRDDGFSMMMFWVVVFGLISLSRAMITPSSVVFSGPSSVFLSEDFGMTQHGVMRVSVSVTPAQVSTNTLPKLTASEFSARYPVYSSKQMGGYMMVIVMKDEQKSDWYRTVPTTDVNEMSQLCTQPSIYRHRLEFNALGQANFTYRISETMIHADSQYSLALLQCYSLTSPGIALAVAATAEMWNVQPGNTAAKSYLGIEDVLKIRVLEGDMLIASLFLTILVAQIVLSMKPWYVLKLHILFLLSIALGLALMAVTYAELKNRNTTGMESAENNMVVSVVDHFNTTTLLACFLLLSLGWCTTRINLPVKEIRFIAGSIVLYFIIGMANAVCMDDSNQCASLNLVTYIIKNLLLLGIIIAMNFTVTQLRAGLMHSPWIPSTPVQYARVKQFQMFRIVFILYLLLPTAFLLVQQSLFTWREDWLVFLLDEVLTLYMYFHVGSTFSPLQEPFLIRAFDNTFTDAVRAQ